MKSAYYRECLLKMQCIMISFSLLLFKEKLYCHTIQYIMCFVAAQFIRFSFYTMHGVISYTMVHLDFSYNVQNRPATV